ncbi:MAG: hypothetical protein PHI41_07680 [Erysipelotrichaceae bacterium]|nr:hypothetical protein [Erysipelotrichaceae bacterium]
MWHEGTLSIGKSNFRYCVKSFGEGSEYGIDGGKISKLMIKRVGRVVCNYDRGWDIKPRDEETRQALESLKATYN